MMKIEDAIRIAHEIDDADDQTDGVICYNESGEQVQEEKLSEYTTGDVCKMMGIVVVYVFGHKTAQ